MVRTWLVAALLALSSPAWAQGFVLVDEPAEVSAPPPKAPLSAGERAYLNRLAKGLPTAKEQAARDRAEREEWIRDAIERMNKYPWRLERPAKQ